MSAHDGADPSGAYGAHDAGDEARRHRLLALVDGDGCGGSRSSEGTAEPTDVSGRPRGLPGLRARLDRVCVVTAAQVGVDGAGVTVMGSADGALAGHRDQLAATGALTRRLEDLQLTVGEGPCVDAYTAGAPVLAGDLAGETKRWLGFGPEALAAGAEALFSLPLQVGVVRLGTLDLHRTRPGALSGEQLADALALAALATEALLELAQHNPAQEDPGADPQQGQGAGFGADAELVPDAGWLPDVHAEVHQASGMVSVQTGLDVGAALLRIRAYAFASGEPIDDVARRIMARDLVLGDEPDHPGPRDSSHDTDPPDGPLAPEPESDD